jgi:hypothetical protein
MVRSEPIRTYMEIGIAILCFVGAVMVGINWLTELAINRHEVGAFIGALGGFLMVTISLWTRYAQKPPTS